MMLRSWHTCLAVTLAVAAAIPASAANRMFPKFDVRDFGAKGDGVVKDTAAIQRAIDAAHTAGGGEVVLPDGTRRSRTSTCCFTE